MEPIEENIQAIKQWLDNNDFEYKENVTDKKFGVHIDIWLAKYRIAIRKSQDDDQDFYTAVSKKYKPFFVRPDETVNFSLEKIRNCTEERKQWLEKFRLRAKRRGEQMKHIKAKRQAAMRENGVKVTSTKNWKKKPGTKFKPRPGGKRKRIQKPANKTFFGPPKIGGFNLS